MNDFAVLLAGSNDFGKCLTGQFSVRQALRALFKLKVETNLLGGGGGWHAKYAGGTL